MQIMTTDFLQAILCICFDLGEVHILGKIPTLSTVWIHYSMSMLDVINAKYFSSIV